MNTTTQFLANDSELTKNAGLFSLEGVNG